MPLRAWRLSGTRASATPVFVPCAAMATPCARHPRHRPCIMADTAGRGVRRERLLHGGKGRTCGHVPCGIALVAPRAVPTPRATPMRIGPTPPHALAVARGHGPHTPRRESARATQHMAMSTHRGVCHACVKHARPWARPHLSSEVHAMRHDWRGGAWRMPRATTARRQGRAGRWGNGGGGYRGGFGGSCAAPLCAAPRASLPHVGLHCAWQRSARR